MIKFFKQLWCYLMLTTDTEVSLMQRILNKVIAKGYYAHNQNPRTSPYMCIALQYACTDQVITKQECKYAKQLIQDYLGDAISLRDQRMLYGLPVCHINLLATYKNWDKRPAFEIDIHA